MIEFRQYWHKFNGLSSSGDSTGMYWRKISGNSPFTENTGAILVKDQWTLANGESPIGEHPATRISYT